MMYCNDYCGFSIFEGKFFHEFTHSNFSRVKILVNHLELSRALTDEMFLVNNLRVTFSRMAIDS